MIKNNENIFKILLLMFILLIFVLNSSHLNQQGTYQNIFLEIGKNLLSGGGYKCSELGNTPLFYPLWGYTLLIIPDLFFKSGDLILYTVQIVLTYITILLFLRIFQIKLKLFYFFLFIPYIALMSVKWPDAIVGSLLIFIVFFISEYINKEKFVFLAFSGVFFGILLNFRSEYVYLPFFLLFLLFLPNNSIKKKKLLAIFSVLIISGILLLTPWAYRSYKVTGEFRTSASNGGAVMYISLGQLPNNSWGIIPLDETAYQIADSLGFYSPYSVEADSYFKALALHKIKEDPVEYIKKFGYNFFSAIIRGVYTGEFANAFIGTKHRIDVENTFNLKKNIFEKINYLISEDKFVTVPIILEKILQAIFIVIFLILIFISILKMGTGKIHLDKTLIAIIICLIIYKFLIVSAIQYEYRHLNSIYLIILGLSLYRTNNTT